MAARSALRTLSLLLTERCNLSCRYCYRAKGLEGGMSRAVMRRAIDILLSCGHPEPTILFTGGEPLLAFPLLREGILHARRHQRTGQRIRLQLATNGTRLTRDVLAFLAEQEVTVQLSFDGVPAAQNPRGRGTFARLDRLLPRIRRRHPHFYRRNLAIGMILTPESIPHLAASIEYFLSLRVAMIRLGPVMARQVSLPLELRCELESQFARVTESCVVHHERTGETPLLLFRDPPETGSPRRGLRCGATLGDSLAIDSKGTAWTCPLFANGDFPASKRRRAEVARYRLGPIAKPAWRDRLAALPRLVAGRGVLRARERRSAYGRCSDCAWAATCGVCPVSLLLCEESGRPGLLPDLPCALHQVSSWYRGVYRERCGPPASLSGPRALRPDAEPAVTLRRGSPRRRPDRTRPFAVRQRSPGAGRRTPRPGRPGGRGDDG